MKKGRFYRIKKIFHPESVCESPGQMYSKLELSATKAMM